jgi:hypothetical protein
MIWIQIRTLDIPHARASRSIPSVPGEMQRASFTSSVTPTPTPTLTLTLTLPALSDRPSGPCMPYDTPTRYSPQPVHHPLSLLPSTAYPQTQTNPPSPAPQTKSPSPSPCASLQFAQPSSALPPASSFVTHISPMPPLSSTHLSLSLPALSFTHLSLSLPYLAPDIAHLRLPASPSPQHAIPYPSSKQDTSPHICIHEQ